MAALMAMEVSDEEELLERGICMGDKTAQYVADLDNPKITVIRHRGEMLAFYLVDASGNPNTSETADLKVKLFKEELLWSL